MSNDLRARAGEPPASLQPAMLEDERTRRKRLMEGDSAPRRGYSGSGDGDSRRAGSHMSALALSPGQSAWLSVSVRRVSTATKWARNGRGDARLRRLRQELLEGDRLTRYSPARNLQSALHLTTTDAPPQAQQIAMPITFEFYHGASRRSFAITLARKRKRNHLHAAARAARPRTFAAPNRASRRLACEHLPDKRAPVPVPIHRHVDGQRPQHHGQWLPGVATPQHPTT